MQSSIENELVLLFRKFGLSENEIRVYLCLLKRNGANGSLISKRLDITLSNIYAITKNLMNKGLIESTFTRPLRFYPVPVDRALDALIMQRKNFLSGEIVELQDVKEEIAAKMEKLFIPTEKEPKNDRFQIFSSSNIISKLSMRVPTIKKSIRILFTKQVFIKIYNLSSFIDDLSILAKKKNTKVQFLLDRDLKIWAKGIKGEIRFIETESINDMILIDDKELFYNIDPKKPFDQATMLWTTLPSLVSIFKNIFRIYWGTQKTLPEGNEDYHRFTELKKTFEEFIDICDLGTVSDSIKGKSGIKHRFDLIIRLKNGIIAVDFIFSKSIGLLQILPFYIKIYDLYGIISRSILFIGGEIDEEAKRFIEEKRIIVKTVPSKSLVREDAEKLLK